MDPTHVVVDSPIGPLTLVALDGALSGLYMDVQRHRKCQIVQLWRASGRRGEGLMRHPVSPIFVSVVTPFSVESASGAETNPDSIEHAL